MIGLPCRNRIEISGYRVRVHHDQRVVEEHEVDDPLEAIPRIPATVQGP